jgi:hypothetical protein
MATMTMEMPTDYSTLFRAGLSRRTNVFDPSENEAWDAQKNGLYILNKLNGFALPP